MSPTLFSDHCDLDLDFWPQFLKYLVFGGICHIVTHFLFFVFFNLSFHSALKTDDEIMILIAYGPQSSEFPTK